MITRRYAVAHLLICTAALLQLPRDVALAGSASYQLRIVASDGQLGISSVDPELSLNDHGDVAFIGRVPDPIDPQNATVDHVLAFRRDLDALVDITPGINGTFLPTMSPGGCQLSNADRVLDRRRRVLPPNPPGTVETLLETWSINATDNQQILQQATPIITEFQGIYPYASINNSGSAYVFQVLQGGQDRLAQVTPNGSWVIGPLTQRNYPMMADNNFFVFYSSASNAVRLYGPTAFGPTVTIASVGANWSSLGRRPGISDDGTVVAFYGVLTAAGATALQTFPGAGIFTGELSYAGSPPVVQRIRRAAGALSIPADRRVAVTSPVIDANTGEVGYVVVFEGTPANSPKGVFSCRVGSGVVGPLAIVQLGDVLPDGTTVSDIAAPNDGVARAPFGDDGSPRTQSPGDHRGAFWVMTASGERVVRATHFEIDSDGDGLFDHWETDGVAYSGPSGMLRNYALIGANPLRKDLYLEVDAMTGLAPPAASLLNVVTAFSGAGNPQFPVVNPDNSRGIQLHIDNGACSPCLDDTDIPAASWANPFSGFRFVKDQGCGGLGCFGTDAERAIGADWPALRTAKSQVYRYCLFADRSTSPTFNPFGYGEFEGNDIVIYSGALVMNLPNPTVDEYAGTFMHELGHTLGRDHGGGQGGGPSDPWRFATKPNYFSVMSYSWTRPMRVPSSGPALQIAILTQIRDSWQLGYSGSHPMDPMLTLNEANLNESAGIGGDPSKTTFVGPSSPSMCPQPVKMGGAVNWNRQGSDMETGIAADIDHQGGCTSPDPQGGASPGEILIGQNDWLAIKYLPRGSSLWLGSSSDTLSSCGLTHEVFAALDSMVASLDCNGNGQRDQEEVAGGTASDFNGNGILDECESPTGIGSSVDGAKGMYLSASPQPASNFIQIEFRIPAPGEARLSVYDVSGRQIRTVRSGAIGVGIQMAAWDLLDASGDKVASGTYFLRLTSSHGDQVTERVTVLR
ncbi:MAG: T9SS type A sorting domain-containing protein [bacterium]